MKTNKPLQPAKSITAALAVLAALLTQLTAPSALAANSTWKGASNGNWNNSANWYSGVPGAADTATFDSTSANNASIYIGTTAGKSISSINFASSATLTFNIKLAAGPNSGGAANLTVSSGGTITVADGFSHNLGSGSFGSGTVGNLVLGGSYNIATTSGNLTIDQPVTQSSSGFGITKSGSGTLTLSAVNTYSGNTTINASGGTVTISGSGSLNSGNYAGTISLGSSATFKYSSSAAQALSGGISGSGALIKDTSSSSTLTLSGAIGYSGPTTVNAGKLVVPSTHTGTGALTNNAALGITASGTSQWQPSSLTLANNCTLEFNILNNAGTTTAPLAPSSPIGTVSGVTININSVKGALIGNSYPLLGNTDGTTNGYALGIQPASAGISGHLASNGTTLIYVVDVTADIWQGTDVTNPTYWDIATSTNWTGNASLNAPAGSYANTDFAVFDDTAATNTVSIEAAVTPAAITFNNSLLNYTVNSSSGKGIGGSGQLTKSGTGTVTLTTTNTYSGSTVINAGTLQIGNGGTSGSIATTAGVTDNAALVYNRSDSLDVGYAISGSGTVTKLGAGTVTLAGLSATPANNYNGGTIIDQGTLAITTTSPAFTGGLTFGAAPSSGNIGNLNLFGVNAQFPSLLVRNANAATNVISIGSGQTLTLTNSTTANVLSVGGATTGAAKLQVTGASPGVGTLTVNSPTRNIVVASTDTTAAANQTLDLSGLGTFNATIASLAVGRPTSSAGAATTGRVSDDSLTLATTNTITASGAIIVGATPTSPNGNFKGSIALGTVNTLNAASFVVGDSRGVGTIQFSTGLMAPSVSLHGATGGTSRTSIYLGDQSDTQNASTTGGGSSTASGTVDFSGGTVDAMIGSLYVGNGATGVSGGAAGSGNGTFTFGGAASLVDINTLVVGQDQNVSLGSTTASKTMASGTFTMNDGSLTVNTAMTIASDSDAAGSGQTMQSVSGTFYLNGGTATVTPGITLGNHSSTGTGGATATVNVTGGTLNVFGDIKKGTVGSGTIASTLTLNGAGATLDMKGNKITSLDSINYTDGTLKNLGIVNTGLTLAGTGARIFQQDASYAGTIQGAITGSGLGLGITKTGLGALTLAGANTYAGNTTISAGTLLVNGDGSAATGAVTIVAGAIFGGVGTVGGVVNYQSGSLANFTVTPTASTTYSNTTYMTFTNAAFLTNVIVKVNMPVNLGNGVYVLATNLASWTTSGTLAFAANSGSLASGSAGTVSVTGNNLVLTVASLGGGTPGNFSGISVSGSNLLLSVTNGTPNGAWTLLESTNLALPMAQWWTNRMGNYDGSGNLTTNIPNLVTNPADFFRLK